MARTARKPRITELHEPQSRRANSYLVYDEKGGARILVERTPDGRLLIEVYRADADVLVRCDPLNYDFNQLRQAPAERPTTDGN